MRRRTVAVTLEARAPRACGPRHAWFRQARGRCKQRKILGVPILASDAGEMITVQFGLTIENLTSAFHPYLTLSEGIKLAAQMFDKDVAKLSCCAG